MVILCILNWFAYIYTESELPPSNISNSYKVPTCHLHTSPPSPLAHDIAVETVQNALMRQLQTVHQSLHVFRYFASHSVSFLVSTHLHMCETNINVMNIEFLK